jgi:type II secretory ATPase GspE/PulE/Tfp pilus assembly ATPase PilB-like protein
MTDTNVGLKTNKASVELGVKQIIERAVKGGTTDIHLEPMEHLVIVRYRRGGLLYVANKLPKQTALPLAKYLKRLADLDVSQTKAAQSGQATLKIGRRNYRLTLSTLPLIDGEKITIHLQTESVSLPTLRQLGLWGKSLERVEAALGLPKGLVVVCSMQNLQVSRTLASLLNVFAARPIKTALIDENSEPLPPNIAHYNPSSESNFSHSHYLKLLQRRAVQVIGVNPVLGKSTAQDVVNAAHKGYLVTAGVPSTNIAEGLVFLSRLSELPVAIGFGGVAISQLVVRGLCPDCRQAYRPNAAESAKLRQVFGLNQPKTMEYINSLEAQAMKEGVGGGSDLNSSKKGVEKLWRARPHGCKQCDHTGYCGTVGLFETCNLNDTIAEQLMKKRPAEVIYRSAVNRGMVTIAEDGLIKALRGLIDLPTALSISQL